MPRKRKRNAATRAIDVPMTLVICEGEYRRALDWTAPSNRTNLEYQCYHQASKRCGSSEEFVSPRKLDYFMRNGHFHSANFGSPCTGFTTFFRLHRRCVNTAFSFMRGCRGTCGEPASTCRNGGPPSVRHVFISHQLQIRFRRVCAGHGIADRLCTGAEHQVLRCYCGTD